MREHLRLGTICGVPVGVNASVGVILAILVLGLAAGRFPELYPDLPTAAYVAAGAVAGVVFLLSLLAHELSHAVVARRNGVGVEGITLWMLGGVAQLEGEAPDPAAELRIAGVGPLVSLLLGATFLATTAALDAFDVHELVVGVTLWLGIINVVLAVFNLIPAAPLDGGRILRSYLWWRGGDRLGSAITAARAGRTFGWVLIAFGIIQFVGGAGFAGLWFALIGWFVTSAAQAEEQHAQVRDVLADTLVADVMTADPETVPPDLTIEQLLERHLLRSRHSTFPITDEDGRPVGLVTLARVKRVPPERRGEVLVGTIACPRDELTTAAADEPLADLLNRMAGSEDGRALVLAGGRLVGIVSPSDVSRRMERLDLRAGR